MVCLFFAELSTEVYQCCLLLVLYSIGTNGAVPFVPHVVFFFQGELDELDRIRAYVQLRTPVVIMDKCGGMADILAFAVNNRY